MKTLVILKNGLQVAAVATSKAKLFKWLEQVQSMSDGVDAWRYHDGSGWADSSGASSINELPNKAKPLY